VKLQEYIEKTNPEKEKPNNGIDFSFWDTPAPTPAVHVSDPIVEEVATPVIPAVADDEVPTVFISYSWDTPEHKTWVLNLSTKLRENGVNVILDVWEMKYGKLLPDFMEQSISKSQRVICIMTPNYKKKTDKLEGGAGYEYSIITAEILGKKINTSKFIPILRSGTKEDATPTALQGRNFNDMSNDADFDNNLKELLRDIHDEPKHKKPAIGPKPKFD
jgi:hypothetical protein